MIRGVEEMYNHNPKRVSRGIFLDVFQGAETNDVMAAGYNELKFHGSAPTSMTRARASELLDKLMVDEVLADQVRKRGPAGANIFSLEVRSTNINNRDVA
jgi:hypothetical protein